MKEDKKLWQGLASFTQLSYLILIPILLCLLLGKWIDDKAGSEGLWTAIFVIVGIAAGLRNLWVWCQRQTRRNQQEEGRRGFGEETAPSRPEEKGEASHEKDKG